MGCGMYLFWFVWGVGITCFGAGFIVQPRDQAPLFFVFGIVFLAIAIFWTYYGIKIQPKIQQEEKKRQRDKKLSEQSDLEQEQRTLAYLEGLEKFHKMDVADAEAYKKGIETMRLVGILMEKSVYQEKKKDWSIMGGIAEGLAGPAAGISVAVNTMNENAKIEAENAARREWGRKQNEHFQDLANQAEAKRQVALTMSELQRKYTAIMAWSPDTLFSTIKFQTPKIDVDIETKAVTISVEWEQHDRSLCIDGAIRAKLYSDGGQYAGCAYLVLPKVGTSKFKGMLSGICSKPQKFSHYKVILEPINLWELASTNNLTDRKCDNLTSEQHQQVVQRYRKRFEAENAKLEEQIQKSIDNPEPIKEKKSIKDFASKHKKGLIVIAICIIIAIGVVVLINFIQNAPYRALKESLNNNTFSAEWAEDNGHKDIGYDDKAMQVVADQLGKYHENNEVEKALYVLSELFKFEVEIDGHYYYASSDFINWIQESAQSEGELMEPSNNKFLKYNLYGYTISWTTNAASDYFTINGKSVHSNNPFWDVDTSEKVCIP